jgi:hypothetical protein
MNRTPIVATLALALAACTPDFDPASKLDGLRVLAVRAEPPEIAPAPADGTPAAPDRAALTSLVLRSDFAADPARTTTVLYVACVPEPGDATPSPCVALASLRDPTALVAQAAQASCAPAIGDAPPPIAFAGVEACQAGACAPATLAGGPSLPAPELILPPDHRAGFDALPPGAPDRILGTQAVVLAFALDATPDELAAGADTACPTRAVAAKLSALWGARGHVLSTKRVRIRGPEAPDAPNRNPVMEGIAAGGAALDPAITTTLAPGTLSLTPVLPAGADALHEPYTELDAAGAPLESTREDWITSWFSSAGELDELHTRGATADEWTLYGSPGARALVAAVVRDLRGGVAWAVRDVRVRP